MLEIRLYRFQTGRFSTGKPEDASVRASLLRSP
jgi:hypothetical protein